MNFFCNHDTIDINIKVTTEALFRLPEEFVKRFRENTESIAFLNACISREYFAPNHVNFFVQICQLGKPWK